jgi:hypothetical protein
MKDMSITQRNNKSNDDKAGAGAALVNKGIALLFDLLKDVKVKSDLKEVIKELEATMPPKGGVLVRVNIGKTPDGAGGYISEYLGIQIIGASVSSVPDFKQQSSKDALRNVCSITDAKPIKGPELKAPPKGINHAYDERVSDNIMRYRNRNPNNKNLDIGGGVLALAYVEEQIIFIDLKTLNKLKGN